MKKRLSYIIVLITILFSIIPRVFAQDVELKNVELVESDGIATPSARIEENSVNISTSLRYTNQHTKYKLTFENTSTENYYSITLPSVEEGNIIYKYETGREIIKPESTVEILADVLYNNYVPYSEITANNASSLELPHTDSIVFEKSDPPTLIEASVKINEEKDLKEILKIESIENINFEIKDEDILKIENGKIIPLKVGKTNISIVLGDSIYIVNVTITEKDLLVINPETKDRFMIIAILTLITLIIFLTIKHHKVGKYVAMILIIPATVSRFFPVFIYADDETITYEINYKVKLFPQRYKIVFSCRYCSGSANYEDNIIDDMTLYDIAHNNNNLDKADKITFRNNDGTTLDIKKADLNITPVINANDGYYYFYYSGCLSGDALVVVYNPKDKKKKKKKLRDVTPDDLLLAWDFDKGEEVFTKPLYIKKISNNNSYYLLKFDDDTELKVIEDHKLFCVNKNKFVNAGEKNELVIGDSVYKADGHIVKLVSKELINESVESCNIITNYHLNLFANDILTSCIFSNIYEIENMKYIKNNKECIDVSKLNISEEYIEGARLKEVPKDFKGSEKETIQYINDYFNKRDMKKR